MDGWDFKWRVYSTFLNFPLIFENNITGLLIIFYLTAILNSSEFFSTNHEFIGPISFHFYISEDR